MKKGKAFTEMLEKAGKTRGDGPVLIVKPENHPLIFTGTEPANSDHRTTAQKAADAFQSLGVRLCLRV